MIYLTLFWAFLRVGCFAFGGGYGSIPLIREIVLSYGWMTEENIAHMIAVSESTPGPLMVNLATYVGNTQAGFFGGLITTLAVVLPSFFAIIALMIALKTLLKNPSFQAALNSLKACNTGIIIATGIFIILKNAGFAGEIPLTWQSAGLTLFLAAVLYGSTPLFKKKISPIPLILISMVAGVIVYGIG